MTPLLAKALGGLVGTLAHTATMLLLRQRGDHDLPPEQLTDRLARPLVRAIGRTPATAVAHFGYGAVSGALMPGRPDALNGALWGVAVWGLSYLGWVPALGAMPPATRHPAPRNAMMIAAHVSWGAFMGWAAAGLIRQPPSPSRARSPSPFRAGARSRGRAPG